MVQTKHLTIMFTDVKGFTIRTSSSSRQELHRFLELHDKLVSPAFKMYGGQIIKTIGDAFLVIFDSPTDALLCGMKIQEVLCQHNQKADDNDKLEVRVAINSGEATLKDGDVFGDPVNIAARLEGIAEPGDIYFTESVYLAMNKSEIPTAEVGYRHFKGIPDEIKIYKVLREGKPGNIVRACSPPVVEKKISYTPLIIIGAVLAAIILFGGFLILAYNLIDNNLNSAVVYQEPYYDDSYYVNDPYYYDDPYYDDSSYYPCYFDEDCPYGEYCYDGYCVNW